jgi:tetrahydromethanopterin S-methyltransferase subunit H
VLRLAANAGGSTLGGLLALASGSRVTLANISAVDIVLANNGGGSAAANRFSLPGGADYGIPVGDSLSLVYDGTSTTWRKG